MKKKTKYIHSEGYAAEVEVNLSSHKGMTLSD